MAPSAVWAVVKADGYGHGAVAVAKAALEAGAAGLCVALVQEGIELRLAGIDAPILLLSEQPSAQAAQIVEHRLTPTVYSVAAVDAIAAAAAAASTDYKPGLHLKIDTGMRRVGAQPDDAVALAAHVAATASVALEAVFTHFACADDPDHPATALAVARFESVLEQLAAAGLSPPKVHMANSAAALSLPEAHRDFVRCGIATYGLAPGPGVAHLCSKLIPAMDLRARVSHVKSVVHV